MESSKSLNSVKEIVARLKLLGAGSKEIRAFLALFILIRFVKDELLSNSELRNAPRLHNLLDELFSESVIDPSVGGLLGDIVHRLSLIKTFSFIQDMPFDQFGDLVKNRKFILEAITWFKNWGGLEVNTRKDILIIFDTILEESDYQKRDHLTSGKALSKLVNGLANVKSGDKILDPCVGEGSFLYQCFNSMESSGADFISKQSLFGYDVSSAALWIANIKLYIAGAMNFTLLQRDSLEDYPVDDITAQKFDIIVAQPPIELRRKENLSLAKAQHYPVPTKNTTEMFIQQIFLSLKSNGRAVIAIPESFLYSSSRSSVELRRFLVEKNIVEIVVGLPTNILIERSGIKGALLVLNKSKRRNTIRFADLTNLLPSSRFSSREPVRIPNALINQWMRLIFAENLPDNIELPNGIEEGTIGSGITTRALWDADKLSLAKGNCDLTPIRKNDDALLQFIEEIRRSLGQHVQVESLSKVAQINQGISVRGTLDFPLNSNCLGYIRIRDLSDYKVIEPSKFIPEELPHAHNKHLLNSGDVLLSKTGTIGKLAIVDHKSEGTIAANNLMILKVNRSRVLPEYLMYYLSSSMCQKWMHSRKRGASIQQLSRSSIQSLPIIIPPLQEQRRIVRSFNTDKKDVLASLRNTIMHESAHGETHPLYNKIVDLMESSVHILGENEELDGLIYNLDKFVRLNLNSEFYEEWNRLSNHKTRIQSVFQLFTKVTSLQNIPAGPALLNVVEVLSKDVNGLLHSNRIKQYRDSRIIRVLDKLQNCFHKIIDNIIRNAQVEVHSSAPQIDALGEVEFYITFANSGFMPLKNIKLETVPNLGTASFAYLSEKEDKKVKLTCNTNNYNKVVDFKVLWQAETLSGEYVNGTSDFAIKLVTEGKSFRSFDRASSPYVTGSPLAPSSGSSLFHGRTELINRMVRLVQDNGNVILLEGNRRAGKTSILKHIEGFEVIPNWLAVYASLQGAQGAKDVVGVPTVEVFRSIAEAIAKSVIKLGVDTPLPNGKIILSGKPSLGIARSCREGISEESSFHDFKDYLEILLDITSSKGFGIVLMLDEFDKLQEGIDNGVTSPQVPENLRFLIQDYPNFSAIFTGSKRLKRLRDEYWSALYGLGSTLTVSSLDEKSAVKVVEEPVSDYLIYSEEAVQLILNLTASQPYLIQKLCNHIFDFAARNNIRSVKSSDVDSVANDLIISDEHFSSLWDYAKFGVDTPSEFVFSRQALLCMLAKHSGNKTICTFGMLYESLFQLHIYKSEIELESDISYLRELELISIDGAIGSNFYRLAVPLMGMWINVHTDEEIVFKNAEIKKELQNVD